MKTYPRWLLLLLLASAALTACTAPVTPVAAPSAAPSEPTSQQAPPPTEAAVSPTPDQPLAALVNGQPIYLVDYERQVAQYQAAVLDPAGIDLSSPEGQEQLLQARERVLDVMIEQVLVEQAAVGMGIVVTDEEVDAALAQLITDVGGEEPFQARLDQDGMTRQDAWNELRAGLIGSKVMDQVTASLPTTAEQVHARHILVDTQEEASQILAQIQSGADFGELAQQYSLDENTRMAGGDLGFFPRGVLLAPEVEEVAFSLQAGQVSDVVPSSFGFHIVKVIEHDPDRPLSPDDLRWLRAQAVEAWRQSLWSEAVIERFVGQ